MKFKSSTGLELTLTKTQIDLLKELYGSEPMDKMNEEITELIEWVSREDPEIKK